MEGGDELGDGRLRCKVKIETQISMVIENDKFPKPQRDYYKKTK